MVFQQPNPFPMSIYDNVAYGPRVHGIKNKSDFQAVTQKSAGGIIGTAFVKILLENNNWKQDSKDFIQSIIN